MKTMQGWGRFSSLRIPKSKLKEIDVNQMKKIQIGNKEDRTLLTRWYF